MKGLTHFSVGAAVGTFFPQAVDLALQQHSFILTLGGVFGIMPDTLDFKLAMFLEENDYIIDPAEKEYLKDPKNVDMPDPQKMANKMAEALDYCWETGKFIKLQLHTVQMGGDLWRHYEVWYDSVKNEVVVEIGPVVTMSQTPTKFPGIPMNYKDKAIAKTKCKLIQAQARASKIDIFNGPSFGFEKKEDGVEILFLPWHRQWSHSPLVGVALGLIVWLLLSGITGSFRTTWLYGLIAALGFNSHILFDLTGFMGAGLAWPFRRKRTEGIRCIKASNPMGNFLVIWTSGLFILWNLNRFAPNPVFEMHWAEYFGLFLLVPAALLIALDRKFGPKKESSVVDAEAEEQEAFMEDEFAADSR